MVNSADITAIISETMFQLEFRDSKKNGVSRVLELEREKFISNSFSDYSVNTWRISNYLWFLLSKIRVFSNCF